jgi:hypothetical protein
LASHSFFFAELILERRGASFCAILIFMGSGPGIVPFPAVDGSANPLRPPGGVMHL